MVSSNINLFDRLVVLIYSSFEIISIIIMVESDENPVVIKRRELDSMDRPISVRVAKKEVDRNVFHQEQVSLDKIVEDSESRFYIAGKTLKMNLGDFLSLVDKHEITEVPHWEEEEIIVASKLVTDIATATVTDEDEDNLKLFDAAAVGVFLSGLLISVFVVFTRSLEDMKTFGWVIFGVCAFFLLTYLYRGYHSGEIRKLFKAWLRKAGK